MATQEELAAEFEQGTPVAAPSQEELASAFASGTELQAFSGAPPAPAEDPGEIDSMLGWMPTRPTKAPKTAQDLVDEEALGGYLRQLWAQPQADPERHARALRVATTMRGLGVEHPDMPWIADNVELLERRLQASHIDFARIAREHPTFARFATDPRTAPVALDDSAMLTGIEKVIGGYRPPRTDEGELDPNLGWQPKDTGYVAPPWLASLKDAWGRQVLLGGKQAQFAAGREDRHLQLFFGSEASMPASRTPLLGVPGLFEVAEVKDPATAAASRKELEELRAEYGVGRAYRLDPADAVWYERSLQAPLEMAPLMAADTGARVAGGAVGGAIGFSVAGPPGALVGAGIGQFLGSFAVNTVASVGPLWEELSKLEDVDGNPIDPELARSFAWAGASADGLLQAALFSKVTKAVPGVRPLLERFGSRAVVETLLEPTTGRLIRRAVTSYGVHVVSGATLMAATSGVNAAVVESARGELGHEANWGRVGEATTEGFKAGLVDMLALAAWAPARDLMRDLGRARASEVETNRLADAIAAARESKLLERSPEEFEAYVARVKLSQGSISDVRIPVEDFARYWTERKVDPAEAAQALLEDGGKAFAEAQATHGDVAIPVERFLARLTKGGHAEGLLIDAKLSQDGLTARQRRALKADLDGKVREYATQPPDQMEPGARRVYEEILGKAKAAGVEPNVADANAKLIAATFRGWADALSERAKEHGAPAVTAWDVFARLAKLEVLGPKAAAGDAAPGERGFITFTPAEGGGQPRQFNLGLLKTADRSTLAHETSHFLSEVMGELASAEGAPERVRADYQQLLAYMGHASHQERAAATAERLALAEKADTSPAEKARLKALAAKEERVSYAWERYLAEGKTPSAELAGVFGRFRSWMARIYKGPAGLEELFRAKYGEDLPVSKEVHQVFNRLLATEAELQRVAAAAEAQPFEPLRARMSPEARAEYDQVVESARREAEAELVRRVTESEKRENAEWFKAERARVAGEVEAELDHDQVHRTIRYLQGGGLGKGALPEVLVDAEGRPFKLDRKALVESYGVEFVRTLPRRIFGEKGLAADELAGLLHWDSGDAMVRALAAAEPREVVIEREMARRLAELYGPALLENPQALAEEALAASHSDAQAQKVLLELRALAKQLSPAEAAKAQGVELDTLRRTADRVLLGKQVGQLYPETYLRQERTAARRALELAEAGKLAEAHAQKEVQALNMFLYRAARDLREQLDRGKAHLVKTTRDAWRAELGKAGPEYRDGHDALLEAIGIGEPRPEERAPTFEPLVQRAERDYQELDFDVDGIRQLLARPRPWRELTVEQAQNVLDAVTNIRHAANAWNEVTILDRRATRNDILTEMEATAAASLPVASKPHRDPLSEGALKLAATGLQHGDAIMLSMEEMARQLDGGNPEGVFTRVLIDGSLACRNRKNELVGRYLKDLVKRWENLPDHMKGHGAERIDLSKDLALPPDVARVLAEKPVTRSHLWVIALNMGNAGNKNRLLGGMEWSEGQVMRVLDRHLTKGEWQWVQNVWDSLEGLYPHVAEVHERATGLRPGHVVASPVETRHGTFRGGYFPAKYDPRVPKSIGMQQADASVAAMYSANYEKAHTITGHAEARAKRFEDVVNLDWGLLPSHVAQVIHDVTHRMYVKEVGSLLLDTRFQTLAIERYGAERAAQFVPWMKAVASAQADAVPTNMRLFHRALSFLKNRVAITTIGHILGVAIGDLTNPVVAVTSGQVQGRFIASALLKALPGKWGDTRTFALESSPELRHRSENVNRHLVERLGIMATRGGRASEGIRLWRQSAYWFLEQTDKITATIVWQGRYQQGLAEGLTHPEAVRAGDASVRKLFPAEEVAERAAILRNPTAGAFLLFAGFQNKMFSVYRGLLHDAWTTWRDPDATPTEKALKTGEVGVRILATAFVVGTLSRWASGQRKDKDESQEEYIARTTAIAPFESALVGSFVEAAVMGKDVNVRASPAVAALQQAFHKVGALRERAENGDLDSWEAAWDALDLYGIIAGVPTRQVRRTGQYVQRLADDQVHPEDAGELARGLVYGERRQR